MIGGEAAIKLDAVAGRREAATVDDDGIRARPAAKPLKSTVVPAPVKTRSCPSTGATPPDQLAPLVASVLTAPSESSRPVLVLAVAGAGEEEGS